MTLTINEDESDHMFSDPEDYEDPITEEELLGDLLEQKPSEKSFYEHVIIVDNIPQVKSEKIEKLKNVLMKTFKTYGEVVDAFYPQKEDGTTKGFVFVEYKNRQQAMAAHQGLQNFKLDSKHTFSTNKLTDIDEFCSDDAEVEIPEQQVFKNPGDIYGWLADEHARDHYAVVYDVDEHKQKNSVAVIQNNYSQPVTLDLRNNWTETTVLWSPMGAYLTSMHAKGVVVWGNGKFEKLMKFKHDAVDYISFSPCETYLVTLKNPSLDRPGCCIIWEVLTGQERRRFQVSMSDSWPLFKWSYNGKYFAKIGQDILQVYETPSFGLLEKQSFKIQGIQRFEWSPKGSYFICWIRPASKEESSLNDVPEKVSVIEVPSRQELCTKSMFFVNKISFHWHPTGDYCCVQSDLRGKKGVFHFLHIFTFGAKDIPVDLQEIKEPLNQFAWEPTSSRFICLLGEGSRANATVFDLQKGGGVKQSGSIDTMANFVSWSPLGRYAILGLLKNSKQATNTGTLEFIDVEREAISILHKTEHYAVYGLEWDPSGRYLASYNRCIFTKHDNHVAIWTFQGRRLQQNRLDSLYQFSWRPRPPRLINNEQKDDIKKNFRKYQTKFDHQDKMSQSKTSMELLEKRRELSKEFAEVVEKLKVKLAGVKKKAETENAFDDFKEEHQNEKEEEVIEFVINQQVIICNDSDSNTATNSKSNNHQVTAGAE